MLAGYRIWEHLWEKQPEVENAYGNAEMSTAPVKIIGIRRQAAIDFHESLTTFPGLPGQMHMPGINIISWTSWPDAQHAKSGRGAMGLALDAATAVATAVAMAMACWQRV